MMKIVTIITVNKRTKMKMKMVKMMMMILTGMENKIKMAEVEEVLNQ